MRHWDKNAGLLVKLGSVLQIENAGDGPRRGGGQPEPHAAVHSGENRTRPSNRCSRGEEAHRASTRALIAWLPGRGQGQLNSQLALKREHLFTQEWLLKNARRIRAP